jgi:predicted O-methyltransferase YrrM
MAIYLEFPTFAASKNSLMSKILRNLIPSFIKKSVVKYVKNAIKKERETQASNIPITELSEIHIKNTCVLVDRVKLLDRLRKNAVVAELGVNKGEFSELILSHTSPKKLHLIDIWGSERYNEQLMRQVQTKFATQIQGNIVEINRGLSTEVVSNFPDGYFDWIYIDTAHSYTVTKAELEMYAPKITPGGIIAGHDYVMGNWTSDIRYGVMEAVYEFCVKHQWEIVYITSEILGPSFGIKKLPTE